MSGFDVDGDFLDLMFTQRSCKSVFVFECGKSKVIDHLEDAIFPSASFVTSEALLVVV